MAKKIIARGEVFDAEVERLTLALTDPEKRNEILQFIANNHLPLNVVPLKGKPSNAVFLAFPDSLPTISPNVDTKQKGKWYSIGIFAHDIFFYNLGMLNLLKTAARNAQVADKRLCDYFLSKEGNKDREELVYLDTFQVS